MRTTGQRRMRGRRFTRGSCKLDSRGVGNGVVLYYKERDVSGFFHGDNVVFYGEWEDLDWVEREVASWFDMEVRGRLGEGTGAA